MICGRRGKMAQQYAHYDRWEDWHAGFFRPDTGGHWSAVQARWAADLLSDPAELHAAMRHAALSWPVAASVNLTSPHVNRRAWLGQAAVCIRLGIPAAVTKQAWHLLTDEQRDAANATADRVLQEWART